MSGIAGIVRFDGADAAPGLAEAMTAEIAHRGPDGIGHWAGGGGALGQCMLRTTAESLEERQPLANEDATVVLAMDGRVDNGEALRRALLARGAALRDRSDAELALRAYEAWGRECPARIDGDFALAVWDTRRRELFCARDRLGIKPFYYHWDGTRLAFASEPRALFALPWIRQETHEGVLAEFLAAEWHSREETLWRGVLRLPAAHRLSAGAGGPRPEPYWEPDLWAQPFRREADYIDGYRELLEDCVRRACRSHRPAAVEVSGGLDSSAVFCLAEHLRRQGTLPAPGIEGYTMAFAQEDGDAYELDYARAAGAHLGLRVHEIPPSRPPLSWYAGRARAGRDFPGFPNTASSLALWRRAAADGSRAVVTGEGGDHWLYGSRAYYAEALAQGQWRTLRDCLRTDAAAYGARQAARWLLRHGVFLMLPPALQETLRRLARQLRGRETAAACYWLSPGMKGAIRRRRESAPSAGRRPVRNAGQRELLETLYDAFIALVMESAERLAAQCGVEMRHPFHDHRLVQLAFSAPARLKLRGDQAKHIHIQALQDRMPQAILERKGKAEFSVVFRPHLNQMRAALADSLTRERPDWIDADGMARLFRASQDDPQAGWTDWVLWSLHGCDQACP
jgi:asparagine synthase (glutamine-hydrolysing)